jgi:hypothetical protein
MTPLQLGDEFKTFKRTVITEETIDRAIDGSIKCTTITNVTEEYKPMESKLTSIKPVSHGLVRIKSTGRVLTEPKKSIKLMNIKCAVIPNMKDTKNSPQIAICDDILRDEILASNVVTFKNEHIA